MEEHSTVPLLAALRIELGALCPFGQSAVLQAVGHRHTSRWG
jgi:hypothetical protein